MVSTRRRTPRKGRSPSPAPLLDGGSTRRRSAPRKSGAAAATAAPREPTPHPVTVLLGVGALALALLCQSTVCDAELSAGALWTGYIEQLEASPYQVKLVSAALIFAVGDAGTQWLLEGATAADLSRVGRSSAFGCVATSYIHVWWGWLEPQLAMAIDPEVERMRNTAAKVACGPPWRICLMPVCCPADEKRRWPQVIRSSGLGVST